MKRGVTDYLVKPVDREKLTAAVADALEQRRISWF
jgi:DNA-binding NtrC family response regulator